MVHRVSRSPVRFYVACLMTNFCVFIERQESRYWWADNQVLGSLYMTLVLFPVLALQDRYHAKHFANERVSPGVDRPLAY